MSKAITPDNLVVLYEASLSEAINGSEEISLKSGDGGGTSTAMNDNISERVSKLEGGWGIFQWAAAIVTALFFAAFALLLTVQLWTAGQVSALSAKVDALPNEINENLLELNRTLSSAITASKNSDREQVNTGLVQQQILMQMQTQQLQNQKDIEALRSSMQRMNNTSNPQ